MASQPARRGFTLFMTGLPGAGKSTLAAALKQALETRHKRSVTVLDGDVVREMLSSGLTFSRADRELNLRRIGYVAGEVTKHGGICICAAIAPFRSARDEARARISQVGGFYEIYLATPLAVCETRRGEIKNFTGIDDPFEPPARADAVIDASKMTVEEEVRRILELPMRDQ